MALYREELMRVVRTLIAEGEIPRACVQEITRKGATVCAEIISSTCRRVLLNHPVPRSLLN